jgi:hypothetical protein
MRLQSVLQLCSAASAAQSSCQCYFLIIIHGNTHVDASLYPPGNYLLALVCDQMHSFRKEHPFSLAQRQAFPTTCSLKPAPPPPPPSPLSLSTILLSGNRLFPLGITMLILNGSCIREGDHEHGESAMAKMFTACPITSRELPRLMGEWHAPTSMTSPDS